MITKIIYQYGSEVENYTVGEHGVISIENVNGNWLDCFEVILDNGQVRNVNKKYIIEFWEKNTP